MIPASLQAEKFHTSRGFNTGKGTWFRVVRILALPDYRPGTFGQPANYFISTREIVMGFGRGALLWILGVPLPIILLLALFMHH